MHVHACLIAICGKTKGMKGICTMRRMLYMSLNMASSSLLLVSTCNSAHQRSAHEG